MLPIIYRRVATTSNIDTWQMVTDSRQIATDPVGDVIVLPPDATTQSLLQALGEVEAPYRRCFEPGAHHVPAASFPNLLSTVIRYPNPVFVGSADEAIAEAKRLGVLEVPLSREMQRNFQNYASDRMRVAKTHGVTYSYSPNGTSLQIRADEKEVKELIRAEKIEQRRCVAANARYRKHQARWELAEKLFQELCRRVSRLRRVVMGDLAVIQPDIPDTPSYAGAGYAALVPCIQHVLAITLVSQLLGSPLSYRSFPEYEKLMQLWKESKTEIIWGWKTHGGIHTHKKYLHGPPRKKVPGLFLWLDREARAKQGPVDLCRRPRPRASRWLVPLQRKKKTNGTAVHGRKSRSG